MIKVIIADDQELIRQSLMLVLGAYDELDIIGTAKNGKELLELVTQKMPDVVLMDIRMPVMDGVECTRQMKQKYPGVKIIVLTTFVDDEYVFKALKHGADGYLLKEIGMEELKDAIVTVYHGGAIINPEVTAKALSYFQKMARGNYQMTINAKNIDTLNQMERLVASYVGQGMRNKEIAEKVFMSEGTVRNYVSQILKKLDLQDRTQLAIWYVQYKAMNNTEI